MKAGEDNLSGLVTEYCNKFPDLPNLTLAKLMYKKYNHVFKDVDSIRTRIRSRRGAHGGQGTSYKGIVKNRGKKDIKEVMKIFKIEPNREKL